MGGELWVVSEMCSHGCTGQNLASVIKWFHEAEPAPGEGQDCLPLPFLPKRKHTQAFPWELRSQVPRFGLFIPCNRKESFIFTRPRTPFSFKIHHFP